MSTLANLAGMDIIVDNEAMSRFREDWSDVRSPSRAKRRLKRGFPQRIKWVKRALPDAYQVNGKLIMHSETLQRLKAAINAPPVGR